MADINNKTDIRLSKSCLSEAEKSAVIRVLDHEFLGMGSEVQAFESELTNFFGRPVVCVSNGTAALHLALQAVGITRSDEVLVQSLTYVASFQAISATGANPVSCDVDPLSLCIDLKDAERKLTTKTKAVMPVHYGGGVGALDDVYAFAEKHGLRVIEDAAHAFGSHYKSQKVGSFGDISCFSFDGIKNITSGEGGCVVTNDETVLEKIRDSRLLGVERDTEKRYSGARSWEFDVNAQGWRYHMSNLMAAIGIEQLRRFTDLSCKRQNLAELYNQGLAEISWIRTLPHDYSEVVPHIYPVIIGHEIDRVEIINRLMDEGIQTGIHYYPNHELSLYRDSVGDFPVIDDIYPRLLTLPLHPDLKAEDIDRVCTSLKGCVDYF